MPELLDDSMLTGGVFIAVDASLYSCMKMSIAASYCSPISLACRQLCNRTYQQFMSNVIAFIELLKRKRISIIIVVMSCLSSPSWPFFFHHFFYSAKERKVCHGTNTIIENLVLHLHPLFPFIADWQLWLTLFCGGDNAWIVNVLRSRVCVVELN